jgi:hypothetical protein
MLKAFTNWLTLSGVLVIAVILVTAVILGFGSVGQLLYVGYQNTFGTKYQRVSVIPESSLTGMSPHRLVTLGNEGSRDGRTTASDDDQSDTK